MSHVARVGGLQGWGPPECPTPPGLGVPRVSQVPRVGVSTLGGPWVLCPQGWGSPELGDPRVSQVPRTGGFQVGGLLGAMSLELGVPRVGGLQGVPCPQGWGSSVWGGPWVLCPQGWGSPGCPMPPGLRVSRVSHVPRDGGLQGGGPLGASPQGWGSPGMGGGVGEGLHPRVSRVGGLSPGLGVPRASHGPCVGVPQGVPCPQG